MELKPVKSVPVVSKDEFKEHFLDTRQPVIIKGFFEGSPALSKWNYSYFKEKAGDLDVLLYGKEDAFNEHAGSRPVSSMKFGDYLDLIETQPTELRLFLFNLLQKRPELKQDLSYDRTAMVELVRWMPLMFFGGAGSSVRCHFDIDMSHVFLTQFQGEKEVWLFDNKQSPFLYKLPYNFHGIASLRTPDYEKFPGLNYLQGLKCTLRSGDTLFIPSGYWHYIQYITGGYSVSHRMIASETSDRLKGFRNLFFTRHFDNAMRRILKEKWFDFKVQRARHQADRAISNTQKRSPV